MTLRDTILTEHSKANCMKIIQAIGSSQRKFDQLVKLFLHDDNKVIQRAGWPLSYIAETHPELVSKHTGTLIRNLRKPGLHNAVKRNTLRIFRDISVPKRYQGELMSRCFDYILSPLEKPAIKSFSLAILRNLSRQYPDIKHEIKTIIEEKWDQESPAFKSQAKWFLVHSS